MSHDKSAITSPTELQPLVLIQYSTQSVVIHWSNLHFMMLHVQVLFSSTTLQMPLLHDAQILEITQVILC